MIRFPSLRPETSLTLIRLAIAGLFLWFGASQALDPGGWTGFLPAWTRAWPLVPETLVRLNGAFELTAAGMLALGGYTRVMAALLGLHLAAIAFSLRGPVAVRDAALAAVALVVAFVPPDPATLDARTAGRRPRGRA